MKKTVKSAVKVIGAALLLGSALISSAYATPVAVQVQELPGMVNGGTSSFPLQLLQANDTFVSQTVNVYVGSFHINVIEVNGTTTTTTTELAFCVDPWNWSGSGRMAFFQENLGSLQGDYAAWPSHPVTLDVTNLSNHVAKIEALYSNFYAGTVGQNRESAAFQLALWEIVSDNGLTSGSNSQIWSDAHILLDQLEANNYAIGSENWDLTAYVANRGNPVNIVGQNFLVATPGTTYSGGGTPVPEPASLLLVGLGLLGLGLVRREKRDLR